VITFIDLPYSVKNKTTLASLFSVNFQNTCKYPKVSLRFCIIQKRCYYSKALLISKTDVNIQVLLLPKNVVNIQNWCKYPSVVITQKRC